MRRKLFIAITTGSLLFAGIAAAQTGTTSPIDATVSTSSNPLSGITFPIPELGNCSSRDACKTYCDDSAHADACFAFAQKHQLMSKEEVSVAKQILTQTGPGGCRGQACKTYCAIPDHQDICIAFAQTHGISVRGHMSLEGIMHATTTALFASGQTGPGGCTDAASCKAYCSDTTHTSECLQFAQKHGLMNKEEISRAQSFASSTGPGGCQGMSCMSYCSDRSHRDECVAFAESHGLLQRSEDRQGTTTQEGAPMMQAGERRGDLRHPEMPRFSTTTQPFEDTGLPQGSTSEPFRPRYRMMPPQERGAMMQGGFEGRDGQAPQGATDQTQSNASTSPEPSDIASPQEMQQDQQLLDNGQGMANWTQYPAAAFRAVQQFLKQ